MREFGAEREPSILQVDTLLGVLEHLTRADSI